MGSVISKSANGVGTLVGNAFKAPFKSIFGGSCEGICSETWDIVCFIEHLCVSNLMKLFMVLILCYITLLFFYLLFKIGICQCIVRSLCKMCWAACETYWYLLEYMTCFLWHKLKNTKRVNRRRRCRDIELASGSSDENDSLDDYRRIGSVRKRKSVRERRKQRIESSLYPFRRRSSYGNHGGHGVRLKTREVSVHVKRGSLGAGHSRRMKNNRHREAAIFKKRRLR